MGTAARRSSGPPAPASRPCCASSPGCGDPDPGRVAMGEEVWLDSGRRIDLRPEERACGFMFQDYALFPHLSCLAERRLRNARPAPGSPRARPGAAPALRCRGACRRPPRLPSRRRAPAGGAGAITGPRPERPAPRRTPGRARHPHPRAGRPRARPRAERDSRARDRRHPRLLGGGNAGRRDLRHGRGTHRAARDRRGAVGATRERLRRRLRGLGGAQRHGAAGRRRADAGRAGWRGRAAQHRPDPADRSRPLSFPGRSASSRSAPSTRARPSTASRSRSRR